MALLTPTLLGNKYKNFILRNELAYLVYQVLVIISKPKAVIADISPNLIFPKFREKIFKVIKYIQSPLILLIAIRNYTKYMKCCVILKVNS